jgi:phage terminase large subunit
VFKKPPKRTDREKAAFAAWLAEPVSAVKDWFGVTPDDWQGDALNGIFTDKDRCAFKAAHGVGKTTLFAWAGWIFLECFENSRLVMTAPTFAQLHDVLLPEYGKWHSKMNDTMKGEWNISGGHIRHKGAPYEWFGVARTSNKPANLQGFHGEYLMIEGDEASAIPAPVFEVIEGALSEAGDDGKIAKLLIGGNPNFTTGELYDAFNRNSDLYHCVTVTGDPTLLAQVAVGAGPAPRAARQRLLQQAREAALRADDGEEVRARKLDLRRARARTVPA